MEMTDIYIYVTRLHTRELNKTRRDGEALLMVITTRGIVPDGMVQTQLLNFVVKFPNLGLVGGGNKTGESIIVKTASCQSENNSSNNTNSGGKQRYFELGHPNKAKK